MSMEDATGYSEEPTTVTVTTTSTGTGYPITLGELLRDERPHVWYGPCDSFEDDGSCSECLNDRAAQVRRDGAIAVVVDELNRASRLHGAFNSAHEGYAVILEEVDELWDDVKRNNKENARLEAIQVAAMAIRYLVDLQ